MKWNSDLSDNYEGIDVKTEYVGYDDVSLSFEGGQSSFLDEGKKGLTYTFTITNTGNSAEDVDVALCPAYFTTASDIKNSSGTAVAAIVAEGNFITTANKVVNCVGKPKSYNHFLAFCKYNPQRITGMKLLVDDAEQLEQEIYIRQESPYRNLEDRRITPGEYKDSGQNDDKRAEVPLEGVQFDNQTSITTTIKAGRTITYTLFVGASANTARELYKKAEIARANVERKFM